MPQFTIYGHARGPNPWKVAMVISCLGLDYETKILNFDSGEHKAPEFTKINPNGRVPALVDHKNNDFTIWESNAIILYLTEKYDTEHKISASGLEDKAIELQWLFFQASGQGPYFGQFAWFSFFHSEKIPSALERYKNEINRVFSVLESVLEKQEWLGGSKATIADIVFITWNELAYRIKAVEDADKYPKVKAWHNKLIEMAPIKKVLQERDELVAKIGK